MTPVFFTDRDLGKRFPDILSAAGLTVERHADHFQPDCRDEDWLEAIGKKRWIAVTHDARIRYKPNELAAVVRHRVALLVVVGHVPYAQLAEAFIATRERIMRFIEEHQTPYIAKVYRPPPEERSADRLATGRIDLWYPPTTR